MFVGQKVDVVVKGGQAYIPPKEALFNPAIAPDTKAIVVGIIIDAGEVSETRNGQALRVVIVQMDDGTLVRVVAWRELAKIVWTQGAHVALRGKIRKMYNEEGTEVNLNSIEDYEKTVRGLKSARHS
jgi:hypothetical protein